MREAVVLFLILVVLLVIGVAASVERFDVPVDTRAYIQQQVQEIEKDVAEAMKPIAYAAAKAESDSSTLSSQYTTLTESVQRDNSAMNDLRAQVAGLRAQMDAAARGGANVTALAARVDAAEAQLSQLSGQQESARQAMLDAIKAATLDISNRTNEEIARANQSVGAAMDAKVKEYNEALRLLPIDASNAVRIVATDNKNSFLVLDASKNRATVVSRARDVPFVVGQMSSATDAEADVDVIIDGRTQSYHAIGFGPDKSAFAGLRKADEALVLGSAGSIRQVSKRHVFAVPSAGTPSMSALGDADPGFNQLVSIDSDGVHLKHHDIVSTPTGLEVCSKGTTRCVRVASPAS